MFLLFILLKFITMSKINVFFQNLEQQFQAAFNRISLEGQILDYGYKFEENKIYEFDKWTGDEFYNRVSVVFKEGSYCLPKDLSKRIIAFYKRQDMDPIKREKFFNNGFQFEPVKSVKSTFKIGFTKY